MTNHWIDIKNADVVLIIGSNAAEHHPVSFKWIMRAKDNGAALIHVDPKFSRTSARCDYHVPLRSGTDIAFLGGMVNYILESNSYFHDYVVNYTNASFIVGKGYDFKDGLFSGYDAKARKYDQSKWGFEKGPDGAPLRDATLKHERCVFNLMKKHYSRYTLKNVSDTCHRSILEKLGSYRGGRTGDGGNLLCGTVTNNDSILKEFCIFCKVDVNTGTSVDLDFCGSITEERYNESSIGWNCSKGVTAVNVSHRILGRTSFELYRSTGNRFSAMRVDYSTGHIDVLGTGNRCRSQQHQGCNQKFRFFHKHLLKLNK